MKKCLIPTLFFLLLSITMNAQPIKFSSIKSIKPFIGQTDDVIAKILEKNEYHLHGLDKIDGLWVRGYFDEEMRYWIEVILDSNNKCVGVWFGGINDTEYQGVKNFIIDNKYSLLQRNDTGTIKTDIWQSPEKQWEIIITYKNTPDFKLRHIKFYLIKP